MKKGFTLIETLLYLGLYTIIIGGMLAAIYGMFQSNAHNETQAMLEEEGDFLVGKINWILSNTLFIQSPKNSGSILTIIRSDGTSVSLSSVAENMRIREGSSPAHVLNNSNVSVLNPTFVQLPALQGATSEGVSASFRVIATTSDGHPLQRNFTTLHYLRI